MLFPFRQSTNGILQQHYDPEVAYAAHAIANRPHRHEPWRKVVLVPIWTLQLSMALAVLVLGMFKVVDVPVSAQTIIYAVLPYILSAIIVLEIIVFANLRLEPLAFVATQFLKLVIWIVIVALTPTLDVYNPYETLTKPSTWPKIVCAAMIPLFFASLFYGSFIHRRYRHALKGIHSQRFAISESTGPTLQDVGVRPPNFGTPPTRPYVNTKELEHPVFRSKEEEVLEKKSGQAAPPYTVVSEQPDDHDVKFGIKRITTQELTGDSETYELSTARSMKSSSYTPDLVSPEDPVPPRRF